METSPNPNKKVGPDQNPNKKVGPDQNPNKKVGPDQNPNVSDPLKRILFMTIHVCVC